MKRVLAASAVLALGVVAGCSSAPDVPPTPRQVAHEIGAVVTGPADHGPFAKAAVQADWNGTGVVIATFSSDAQKRTYIKYVVSANKAFGTVTAPLKQGHDYVLFPTHV